MAHPLVHQKICENYTKLVRWYGDKASVLAYPIYSSYDVRDAGYKVGIVDANIFPAGFNNICPTDLEEAPKLFKAYLEKHYPNSKKKILLVTEEHTQNPFYWDNVWTIKNLLEQAGCRVLIGFPRLFENSIELESASGKKITVCSAWLDQSIVREFGPDLIISNNDFSDEKAEWAKNISIPIVPPRELGWYQRKKSHFFHFYNQLVEEFCSIAELDPFLLSVKTEEHLEFDITNEASVDLVSTKVDLMIANLRVEYSKRNIQQEPFVFVKNNSGTYGLGVVKVNSGEEFRSLNYKSRKKMKAAKGGKEVDAVVIQEGIPSILKSEEGATAEPVIYMVGCHLAGGFFRTHKEKSDTESLNSPGAVYKKMCIADLSFKLSDCPCENVYGWISKLSLLAIALEGEHLRISYPDFIKTPCPV